MEKKLVYGILIDKSRFKDNSLIINILDSSGCFFSSIYFVKKSALLPIHLGHYEFLITDAGGKLRIDEIRPVTDFAFRPEFSDQYFLVAELCKAICKDASGEDLYGFLVNRIRYFKGEYRPSFHIEFLVELIDLLGYLPEVIPDKVYFDLRQAIYCADLPTHPDYCRSEILFPAFNFTNDKSSFIRIQDSRSRAELFFILIRFLELQKGIKISFKSIDILRDLR